MVLDQRILQRLNEIGMALSRERRTSRLLEMILTHAKELTSADGGTIYTITPENMVHFEIAKSTSLGLHVGGTSRAPVPFNDLPLFMPDGTPNDSHMVAYAVNNRATINVKDAYHEHGFDFSGTRAFDEKTGYRTRSVLTVPIKNHEGRVIAGLQLINPPDGKPFSEGDVQLAESLASQAGVALTNQFLIVSLRNLFESLIRVVAEAVDEKSPSTGNHGKRVPVIAVLLAEAVSETDEGPFKEVHFSKEELYELKVAAFLHDCGKITTPVHVVEKKTKLETICDRIELVKMRFAALQEKMEKELLQQKLEWLEVHYPKEYGNAQGEFARLEREFLDKARQMREDGAFIERVNTCAEKMDETALTHLKHIANIETADNKFLLTPNELENLSVMKGNLTEKEREIIKHHVVMTYRMLAQLDFPSELRLVPEIASSHHERVDGKGYPRGLTKEEMLLQARILVVADVFEALSAPDRPYRAAQHLSVVFGIMKDMVDEGHLDADVFEVFLKKKAYLPYARQYLTPEQIDTE